MNTTQTASTMSSVEEDAHKMAMKLFPDSKQAPELKRLFDQLLGAREEDISKEAKLGYLRGLIKTGNIEPAHVAEALRKFREEGASIAKAYFEAVNEVTRDDYDKFVREVKTMRPEILAEYVTTSKKLKEDDLKKLVRENPFNLQMITAIASLNGVVTA